MTRWLTACSACRATPPQEPRLQWENLDNAMGTYQKLIAKIAALKPSDEPIDEDAVTALREKFNKALGNDLNTSLGITALYDVLKYQTNDATKLYLLDDFDKVLSLDLLKKADEAQKRRPAQRERRRVQHHLRIRRTGRSRRSEDPRKV